MNRQRSILLFAAIAAVAMTTVGLSGVSATPLMTSSIPANQAGMGMYGHVEYTVMDSANNVIGYMQGDNAVVDQGKDCASEMIFNVTTTDGNCGTYLKHFQYIAIGNTTSPTAIAGNELTLEDDQCAGSASGEISRKLVVPTITTSGSGSGIVDTIVTLEVPQPFTFSGSEGNTTTVTQSGIFNGLSTDDTYATYQTGSSNGNGSCGTYGTEGTDWKMFSIQNLNGGSGIQVTDGDSLSVKWTITVG